MGTQPVLRPQLQTMSARSVERRSIQRRPSESAAAGRLSVCRNMCTVCSAVQGCSVMASSLGSGEPVDAGVELDDVGEGPVALLVVALAQAHRTAGVAVDRRQVVPVLAGAAL